MRPRPDHRQQQRVPNSASVGTPLFGNQAFHASALLVSLIGLIPFVIAFVDHPLAVAASRTGLHALFRAMPSGVSLLSLLAGIALLGLLVCTTALRSTHGSKAVTVSVLSALIAYGCTTWLLKPLFARTGPMLWVWHKKDEFHFFSSHGAHTYFFPSGHMAFMTALMIGLATTLPGFRAVALCVCIFTAAILVAVDAHFLSDTLAGAVAGASTVPIAAWMWDRSFLVAASPLPR